MPPVDPEAVARRAGPPSTTDEIRNRMRACSAGADTAPEYRSFATRLLIKASDGHRSLQTRCGSMAGSHSSITLEKDCIAHTIGEYSKLRSRVTIGQIPDFAAGVT